jgi:hypothetical protein
VTLTTHPHLVPRSMSRSYTSSPPNASVACSGTAVASVSISSYWFSSKSRKLARLMYTRLKKWVSRIWLFDAHEYLCQVRLQDASTRDLFLAFTIQRHHSGVSCHTEKLKRELSWAFVFFVVSCCSQYIALCSYASCIYKCSSPSCFI